MDLEDLKTMVIKGLPGWQITSNPVSRHIVLSHLGCSIKRSYSYKDLLIASPEQILTDMHAFCIEAVAEAKKVHIGHSPDCMHSETLVRAELIHGHTLHCILCKNCGDMIFPKYIPGEMIPKAATGSKPVNIGSLSISDQFGNELPHSVESNTVTLKGVPHSGDAAILKYKIEDGEMLVQDGDNWLTAKKAAEETKKKAKKIDVKPGQRKVKFKPS